jgi:hypothetical protein
MSELEQMDDALRHMGPVDYAVFAWPGEAPSDGRIASMIVDLHDKGIIRILDIAFAAKDNDGNVVAIDLANMGADNPFAVFDGASSGMMDEGDLQDAAEHMEPGSAGAVLVWENLWAAPIATAIRESGGLLIDGGRIPVQGVIAALDALEAADA